MIAQVIKLILVKEIVCCRVHGERWDHSNVRKKVNRRVMRGCIKAGIGVQEKLGFGKLLRIKESSNLLRTYARVGAGQVSGLV